MKQGRALPRFRPTAFGALLLSLVVAAGRMAPRSADPQLAGLAWIVLAGVVAIGALWPVVAVGLVSVELIDAPVDAIAGEDFGIDIRLRGWSSSLELRLDGASGVGWHRVSAPGAGRLTCSGVARGRYDQLMLEMTSAAPLGVLRCSRTVVLTMPTPLYVAPSPLQVDWRPDLVDDGAADGESPLASITGDTVRSVRPYVPGDPSHLVHWHSSARAGALMIHELEPPAQVGAAVVVDLGDDEDRAEYVASQAAGVVGAVAAVGGRITLSTCGPGGARTDQITTVTQAMRLLAEAVPGPPGSAPHGWPIVWVHS